MPFVPVVTPPPQAGRRVKALSGAIVTLCEEFQQREGALKPTELQMAFTMAARELRKRRRGGANAPAQIVAFVLAGLVLMAGLVLLFVMRGQ